MATRTQRQPVLPIRESDLVDGIVQGLRYRGRIVLRCGQWRADKAGSDAALPDLWVYDGAGKWIGLEVKTPTGRLSRAQQKLAGCGAITVVRSIAEAFAACGETL